MHSLLSALAERRFKVTTGTCGANIPISQSFIATILLTCKRKQDIKITEDFAKITLKSTFRRLSTRVMMVMMRKWSRAPANIAPMLEWLLSKGSLARKTATMTLNTTNACVKPIITSIWENRKKEICYSCQWINISAVFMINRSISYEISDT